MKESLRKIWFHVLRAVEWRQNLFVRIIIGVVIVMMISALFPGGTTIEIQNKPGSVWTERDLIAPFSFPIYKDDQQYREELRNASQSVIPVFERNEKVSTSAIDSLNLLFTLLEPFLRSKNVSQPLAGQGDSIDLPTMMKQIQLRLTSHEWEILGSLRSTGISTQFLKQKIQELLQTLYSNGIIDQRKERLTNQTIALRKNVEEQLVPLTKLVDINESAQRLLDGLTSAIQSDNDTMMIAYKIGLCFLKPNIIFNKDQTAKEITIAEVKVPRTLGLIQEGSLVVARGERVSDDVKLRLDSYQRFASERNGQEQTLGQYLGNIIHVTVIIVFFLLYLYLFRKKIITDNLMMLLIGVIFFLGGLMAWITRQFDIALPLEYVILVPALAMVLTIAFDSRVGFYGTVAVSLLVGGIRGNDYAVVLPALVAGAFAAYTVRNVTHRTQIFRSLGYVFLGYAVTISALALERGDRWSTIGIEIGMAAINAVSSPVLTFGLLIVFERVFRITTDLRLIDLSDDNHPLLKKLSEVAPGTFHHSMSMGILAEAAAEAIQAHSLLARVGAYYHDIGKIDKPEYFVENQDSPKSKHDRLKPRMSALILINHVKEGIDLARSNKLPDKVIDFIPEHHGTSLISYFYHKAHRRRSVKEDVNENDYRYPGPKPQSKETGIVMLADGIEASVRALDDPTPSRIESQIDAIVKTRFNDGQLDECDLTLKDLTKIKEAFLRALTGIHHARIKYPGAEDTIVTEQEEQMIPEQEEPAPPMNEPQPLQNPPEVSEENKTDSNTQDSSA